MGSQSKCWWDWASAQCGTNCMWWCVFLAADVSCDFGSMKYYALCGFGGILSCGITHTAVVPLDLVKCRLQVCIWPLNCALDPTCWPSLVTECISRINLVYPLIYWQYGYKSHLLTGCGLQTASSDWVWFTNEWSVKSVIYNVDSSQLYSQLWSDIKMEVV